MQRPVVVTEVFIVTFHDESARVGAEPVVGGTRPIELTARVSEQGAYAGAMGRDRPWAVAEPPREGLGSAVAGSGWAWAGPESGGPTPLRQALSVVPAGPTGGAAPAHTMPARPAAVASGPLPPVPIHALHGAQEEALTHSVLPFPAARRMECAPPRAIGGPRALSAATGVTSLAAPAALPARTEVRIAPSILRAMAEAATESGRGESAVWAEAARAWLAGHAGAAGATWTPAPAQSAGEAMGTGAHERIVAARRRCWSAIDILLGDLRAPRRAREIHIWETAEDKVSTGAGVGMARTVRVLAPGGDEPPPAA